MWARVSVQTIRPLAPCGECGKPLDQPATGRRRRYCSESCKSKARRHRRAIALPYPPLAPDGYPHDPELVRRRTAEALAAALAGAPAAAPIDQLAQGILELDWIVYRLRALERELPTKLAGRAGELAKEVGGARARLFPEIEEVHDG